MSFPQKWMQNAQAEIAGQVPCRSIEAWEQDLVLMKSVTSLGTRAYTHNFIGAFLPASTPVPLL